MNEPSNRDSYDNISQRVIATFLRGLLPFEPVVTDPAGAESEEQAASQRDLHGFFAALYAAMYANPARFAMPTSADDCLLVEGEGKERKQEVTKKIKRPGEICDTVVQLLQSLGQKGSLADGGLVIGREDYRALMAAQARTRKAILAGMGDAGLVAREQGERVIIENNSYPRMMRALKEMAVLNAADAEQAPPAFHLARCDFRALLPDYQPDAPSLLSFFDSEARERALRLHAYLLSSGYQALGRIHDIHAWLIQYQGPRKIKGTPLVQIEYSERHRDPLQVRLKCASTERLLYYFAEQPKAVQDDFHRRARPCGGDSCGWCKERKGLGPSVLEYEGERAVVCWYSNPNVDAFDEATLEVLQGYVLWHQRLAGGAEEPRQHE